MKRTIAVVMALLALSLCLAGCHSKNDDRYVCRIVTSANDPYGAEAEVNYWTGTYFEKEQMPEKSCSFQGKTYTGTYRKSIVDKMNSYTTDVYEDGNHIEFGLRSDTGQLAYINLMNAEFFDTEPYLKDVEHPSEHAASLSQQLAGQYLDDLTAYERIDEDPTVRSQEKDGKSYEITYYVVTYARKIGDYLSSDYLSVKTTSKGHLASVMMGDLAAFDGLQIDVSKEELAQSISDKITSIYQGGNFEPQATRIKDQRIALDPDGRVCVYSNIAVSGKDGSAAITTGVSLLTVIGSKGA